MIYDQSTLKLISSGFIRYKLSNPEHPNTRDIVWGKFLSGKDTILNLVNHWPSRRGGEKESEPNRIIAASAAHHFIDSVMKNSPKMKIIFMGDLNDYPTNMAPKLVAELLTPQITKESGEFGGSYNYRSEWDVLDHIMVSPNFLKGKGLKVVKYSGKILSPAFLITEYKGDKVPKRNYGGEKYLEGYSDHLPVIISVNVGK
jgi:predicted extracellular nuclease